MVMISNLRNAAKRIPMIKFRSNANHQTASAVSVGQHGSGSSTTHASSGTVIEDWQIPVRYRRRPIDDKEIDAINSGGAY